MRSVSSTSWGSKFRLNQMEKYHRKFLARHCRSYEGRSSMLCICSYSVRRQCASAFFMQILCRHRPLSPSGNHSRPAACARLKLFRWKPFRKRPQTPALATSTAMDIPILCWPKAVIGRCQAVFFSATAKETSRLGQLFRAKPQRHVRRPWPI